jgi:hypothetical protein
MFRSLNLQDIEDRIIGYNYYITFWTSAVSEQMKRVNMTERVFGQFLIGPGQNHA